MDHSDDKPVIYDDASSVSEHSPLCHGFDNYPTLFPGECLPAEFEK